MKKMTSLLLFILTSYACFSQLIQQSINRSYSAGKNNDELIIKADKYYIESSWLDPTEWWKVDNRRLDTSINRHALTSNKFYDTLDYKNYLTGKTDDLRRIKKLISQKTDKSIAEYDSISKLTYANINSIASDLLIKKTVYDELKDSAKDLYNTAFKSIYDSCNYNLRRIENTLFQIDKLKDINAETKEVIIDTIEGTNINRWDSISRNLRSIDVKLNNPRVNQLLTVIREQFLKSNISFDSIIVKINKLNQEVAKIRDKKTENGLQLGTDNSINALIGESRLVPQISILAAQNTGKGDLESDGQLSSFQAKIYSGGTESELDTSNIRNLFLPEASSLGINIEFDKAWALKLNDDRKGAKQGAPAFGFNVGIGYLLKNHKIDSALSAKIKKEKESFGVIQGRFGIQLILLKNYISFYASQNFMFIGENVAAFETYYDNQKKLKWFTDVGFKFYAPLVKDKSMNLQIDTRFIINGRDLKDLTKKQDSFLPRIQIGFVKEFAPFK